MFIIVVRSVDICFKKKGKARPRYVFVILIRILIEVNTCEINKIRWWLMISP